jgi:hypothetical protein
VCSSRTPSRCLARSASTTIRQHRPSTATSPGPSGAVRPSRALELAPARTEQATAAVPQGRSVPVLPAWEPRRGRIRATGFESRVTTISPSPCQGALRLRPFQSNIAHGHGLHDLVCSRVPQHGIARRIDEGSCRVFASGAADDDVSLRCLVRSSVQSRASTPPRPRFPADLPHRGACDHPRKTGRAQPSLDEEPNRHVLHFVQPSPWPPACSR